MNTIINQYLIQKYEKITKNILSVRGADGILTWLYFVPVPKIGILKVKINSCQPF